MFSFRDAISGTNAEWQAYLDQENAAFRAKMIAKGNVFFPTLNRWYPAGTVIKGVEPEAQ